MFRQFSTTYKGLGTPGFRLRQPYNLLLNAIGVRQINTVNQLPSILQANMYGYLQKTFLWRLLIRNWPQIHRIHRSLQNRLISSSETTCHFSHSPYFSCLPDQVSFFQQTVPSTRLDHRQPSCVYSSKDSGCPTQGSWPAVSGQLGSMQSWGTLLGASPSHYGSLPHQSSTIPEGVSLPACLEAAVEGGYCQSCRLCVSGGVEQVMESIRRSLWSSCSTPVAHLPSSVTGFIRTGWSHRNARLSYHLRGKSGLRFVAYSWWPVKGVRLKKTLLLWSVRSSFKIRNPLIYNHEKRSEKTF